MLEQQETPVVSVPTWQRHASTFRGNVRSEAATVLS
jgi:hypothetical protein